MIQDPSTYLGPCRPCDLITANGIATRTEIDIEMQIVKVDGTAITDWFGERAIITPPTETRARLSGSAMRNHLYFATAPGNNNLFVAVKENGIVTQLPVV